MTFYRSIYVKKVMKLLAFIFEQPSYCTPYTRDAALFYIADEMQAHTSRELMDCRKLMLFFLLLQTIIR